MPLPDLTRPDVATVLVAESPAAPDLPDQPWPPGLLSVSTFASSDGACTYTQWSTEPDHTFVAALTGADPVEYTIYRQSVREHAPAPGIVVMVRVTFDGPDAQRQRDWVDTVFDALGAETDPHPGGISGHFHLSTDGTRMLNYAEWTDEESHIDALARSNQSTVGTSPGWRRVLEFPGVKESGFRRYRVVDSRSAGARSR